METSKQLANRFREVHLDGTWIASTNYKDQLMKVSWEQATTKIGSLNTIAALTFHINYYITGISDFFENGFLKIKDKYSFDLSPINSEKEWNSLMTNLINNADKFASQVESMPDQKLEEVFADEKYGSFRRNIEGLIEHSYYHLGQITLIKKMLMEAKKE